MKRLLLLFALPIIISTTLWAQCPVTIEHNGPLCYELCNGYANVVNETGVPPFTYQWSIGSQMQSINEVCPGTYYVTVTDNVGCIAIDSVTFTQWPMLSLLIDSVHPATCSYSTNGEAWANAVGGVPPYTYNWMPTTQTTPHVTGLAVGSYYPQVMDSVGCSASNIADVMGPPPIYFSEMVSPSSCSNNSGFIEPYTSGGIPYTQSTPYIYQWSCLNDLGFTSTSDILFSLAPGIYELTVTDSIGCTAIKTFELNTSNGPIPSVSWQNVTCYGAANGLVDTVVITNSSGPFNFLWNTGETVQENPNPLAPGNYWIKVTDVLYSCSGFDYFTVIQPSAIVDNNPYLMNVNCFGDTTGYIYLDNIQGGTPNQIYPYYNFLWNTGDSSNAIYNAMAGAYSVTVTDLNGCTFTESFNITSPPKLLIDSMHISDVTCNGMGDGSAELYISGGVIPYYFSLDSVNWDSDSTIIQPLIPGPTYHVYVKDNNYCHTVSSDFTVNDPPVIDLNYTQVDPTCIGDNGTIDITTYGGVPPFTIIWDTPLLTDSTVTGLSQGMYNATITDANGCVNELNFIMVQTSLPAVLRGSNSYSGGALPLNEAEIILFKSSTNAAQMDTTAITTNSASMWEFAGLLPGTYFVKTNMLNSTSYPNILNSYYDSTSTFLWEDADPIVLSCDDTVSITLNIYEIVTPLTGTGTISGSVHMVSSKKAVGEPVPGAEILIEQEPNDVPVQCAYTNTTGDYTIIGLVAGTGYHLLVDIPGFPLLSTYQDFTIPENDTVANMNFLVDSTTVVGIYMDTASYVSVINNDNISLEIYPNPFVSFVNVKLTLKEPNDVSIELFDALGRKVQETQPVKLSTGKHEFIFKPTQSEKGSCYLIVHAGKTTIVKKLISSHN